MTELTRRRLLATTATAVGAGSLGGCLGEGADAGGGDGGDEGGGKGGDGSLAAQSSFFVFNDLASAVAGDAAAAELLVPVGQHGHGWEPGPGVRESIRDADLLVHGMDGFQPWVDEIRGDLEADGDDTVTVDASADVDLIRVESDHDDEHDNHDHDHDDEGHDNHDHDHDHGMGTDPHFWMDPVRLSGAVDTVRRAFADADPDNAAVYADNAAAARARIDDVHERLESIVADGSREVVLVAGHDAYGYLTDRYGVEVRALTGVSPDDRPTPRDVQRAREVIRDHDLEYVCADPLESDRAAEQIVAETDAREVLPLTAMPGLTEAWAEDGWGYVEVMRNVNLPTLERAVGA